jgi:hypothetical protein
MVSITIHDTNSCTYSEHLNADVSLSITEWRIQWQWPHTIVGSIVTRSNEFCFLTKSHAARSAKTLLARYTCAPASGPPFSMILGEATFQSVFHYLTINLFGQCKKHDRGSYLGVGVLTLLRLQASRNRGRENHTFHTRSVDQPDRTS